MAGKWELGRERLFSIAALCFYPRRYSQLDTQMYISPKAKDNIPRL
jgi:hypothetical protein